MSPSQKWGNDEITKLRHRAEAEEPKAMLAREFGISRDTLYRYLKPDSRVRESEPYSGL